MNRSILIVICDFLLVSLLVFTNVDVNQVAQDGRTQAPSLQIATNQPSSGSDLTAAMKLALEDEQKQREQLRSELARTRQTAGETDLRAQSLQQQLQASAQQATALQEKQNALAAQYAASQTNIEVLSTQLHSASNEALLTKEELAALQAQAQNRSEANAELQRQLADLSRSNQMALGEQQRLAGKLQLAELERLHASEQVSQMTEEVKAEREEKARLADNVKALASNSGALAKEIHSNQALTPNTIFNDFISNRVEAAINGSRSGFFGNKTSKHRDTETILVADGTNTYALCHVQDTPFTLGDIGSDWAGLTGWLGHGNMKVPLQSVSFGFRDPRVVLFPVTAADVQTLGCKVYRTSAEPFKFQDAVLVGGQDSYYGECAFQIDSSTPDYVRLDNNFLKGLFGKFNPSRGDLVFSKNNELLGIMVNSTYCRVIRDFDAGATLRFGNDVLAQHTSQTLAELYAQVVQMPLKLQ